MKSGLNWDTLPWPRWTNNPNPSHKSDRLIPTPLLDALTAYAQTGRRRFHVPGHAGWDLPAQLLGESYPSVGPQGFYWDQTEVEGLDVLSEPLECIQAAQAEAAQAFGVAHSYFLVNGSSVGLHAALLSAFQPGDFLLLPRNVHRSVMSGLILGDYQPCWFMPSELSPWGIWSGITCAQVKAAYQQFPQAKGLVITSPTYEGIRSEVAEIATFCRSVGIILIVDEAHGSLWPFSNRLPASACHSQADAVIQSLHKTGGSLTQSALIHLPTGSRICPNRLQQALNTLQTTSPSYLLLASLDAARAYLSSELGQARIDWLLDSVFTLRAQLKAHCSQLSLLDDSALEESSLQWDPTRLYLHSPGRDASRWAVEIESMHQLPYEHTQASGSLYIAGLGLQTEDFEHFLKVMCLLDKKLRKNLKEQPTEAKQAVLNITNLPAPIQVLTPREAFFFAARQTESTQALGHIAKETIVHCPPGIPILLPGERIQAEHLPYLPEQIQTVSMPV